MSKTLGIVSRLRTVLRLACLAALLPLAACYESDREIIPVALGERVPLAHDQVVWSGNEEGTHFVNGADGNDYRYEHHRDDDIYTGVLRAMRIKDDIYAVQIRPDDADYYQVLFYRVAGEQVTRVDVGRSAAKALATRAGVGLTETGFGYGKLSGPPETVLAFVRGHAELDFHTFVPPPRRR